MQMPVMDGPSAARAIRTLPAPAGRTPIIGISADAIAEHRAAHMAAGLDDYLTKPIDWAVLAATLARHCMAAPQPPLLDPAVIDPLRTQLTATRLDELLAIFADNLRTLGEDLAAARRKGDTAGLRRVLHALVGTAGSFGAARLDGLARGIQSRRPGPDDPDFAALEAAIAATLAEIAAGTEAGSRQEIRRVVPG
jgi:CheY-like chemotaxis protein